MIRVDVVHHPHLWAFEHVLRYIAYWIAFNSLVNNFLPCDTMLKEVPHMKRRYLALVDANSFFALNFRTIQPSIQVLTAIRMEWLRRLVIRYFGVKDEALQDGDK